MATSANYSRLGLFIVCASALIIGAIVWFGGAGGKQFEFLVETYFSDPVSGLDVGSAVNFRGVKVGSVKRISFIATEYPEAAPEDHQTIWVQIALDRRLVGMSDDSDGAWIRDLVDRGIHATVSASGVTGLSHIEVNFPKTKIKDKKISWKPRSICVPPAPSILQNVADSVQHILDQINRMDIVEAWTNLITTIHDAGSAFNNASILLDSQRGNLGEIIDNVRDTTQSLRAFADQIRDNPGAIIRDRPRDPLAETR